MKIKTAAYQRVINLGNYESKRLELTADIEESDVENLAIRNLMELVEAKVREDAGIEAERKLRTLKEDIFELEKQHQILNNSVNQLSQEVINLKHQRDALKIANNEETASEVKNSGLEGF